MRRIAFICHGNICRSVMAEYILKDRINKENIKDIYVDSYAVSFEEIGNSIYPPAKRELIKHNVPILNHRAKHFEPSDYNNFDEIYYMDESNYRRLLSIKEDSENKYHSLLNRNVSDPWYTDNFEECYNDLVEGINNILKKN